MIKTAIEKAKMLLKMYGLYPAETRQQMTFSEYCEAVTWLEKKLASAEGEKLKSRMVGGSNNDEVGGHFKRYGK